MAPVAAAPSRLWQRLEMLAKGDERFATISQARENYREPLERQLTAMVESGLLWGTFEPRRKSWQTDCC